MDEGRSVRLFNSGARKGDTKDNIQQYEVHLPHGEVFDVPKRNLFSSFDGVSVKQLLLALVEIAHVEGAEKRNDARNRRQKQDNSHKLKQK